MTKPTVTQAGEPTNEFNAARSYDPCLEKTNNVNFRRLVEAFASHLEAAERATIEKVAAFLRENYASEWVEVAADAIERGEWKEMGHD